MDKTKRDKVKSKLKTCNGATKLSKEESGRLRINDDFEKPLLHWLPWSKALKMTESGGYANP